MAQYSPPRYKGFEQSAVAEQERAAHSASSALCLKAGRTARTELDALVELRPGMRRLLKLEPGSGLAEELEIVPLAPSTAGEATALSYGDDAGRILIGLGPDSSLSESWDYYSVVSLRLDGSGNFTEIDRYTVGSADVREVYFLDLSGGGGLDIALPWSSGPGSAGGVDILRIEADGRLTSYAPEEFSSLHSEGAGFSLLDFNSDGQWELEFRYPVLCNSCGYSAAVLLDYDRESGEWVNARPRQPHYYSEQDGFYRAFLEQVKQFARKSDDFRQGDGEGMEAYACMIDGTQYSLAPFLFNEMGSVDPFWVDELSSFVLNIDGIIPIQTPEEAAELTQ